MMTDVGDVGTHTPPTLTQRQAWLRAFAAAIRDNEPALCHLVRREIGKPAWETLVADVLPLLASIRWHERALPGLLRRRRLGGRSLWQLGQRHWTERVPVGRVLLIATWNYPLQLLGIQLVQAIAAGNRVVVKPSERCPETHTSLLALASAALVRAGLPKDLIGVRPATRDEGARLLREEQFDHVVFTGSTSVGRAIAEIAARTLTPTTLELSGHDSAIVLDDADPRLAARTIWNATIMNAGQTCMAPRRVLVQEGIYQRFVRELAPLVGGAAPVRLVDEAAAMRCAAMAEAAMKAGGRALNGVLEGVLSDTSAEAAEECPRRCLRPIAIVDCPVDTELFAGDHFGPALAVTPVESLEEAIDLQRSAQSLATSVFTRAPARIVSRAAEFGSCFLTLNDCVLPTAHPAASLSGRGASGWGTSRGVSGLLALTREVTISSTGWLRPPPETPSAAVLAWIRRIAGIRGVTRDKDAGAVPAIATKSVQRSSARSTSMSVPSAGESA